MRLSMSATKVSLGRAVALTALAPLAGQLAKEHERREKDEARRRQLEDELAALPSMERPTPPRPWAGEPWGPRRIVGETIGVLIVTFFLSMIFVICGAIIVAILGGSDVLLSVIEIVGICMAAAIAVLAPIREIRKERAHRHRSDNEKTAYDRTLEAFDTREADRNAVRAKLEKISR
jgi:hypothetical protein